MYIELYTDSSRWGMGAWCEGEWWSVGWPEQARRETAPSMTWLELIPIVVACVIWGERWSGRRVRVYYDNMGVVGVWGRGWSGNAAIMALVPHLLFWAARKGFSLDVEYVATKVETQHISVHLASRVPVENRLLLGSRSSGKSLLARKSRLAREALWFRVTV